MSFQTADLYDAHGDELDVAEASFVDFGGRPRFSGPIATLKVYEDNTLVRQTLEKPGSGRVLVVDGAGSKRFALVGDRLAILAVESGWAGLILFGCVRDSVALKALDIGIRALGACPRKTEKRGSGLVDLPVTFGGARFRPGDWVYTDEDGIVVSPRPLLGEDGSPVSGL